MVITARFIPFCFGRYSQISREISKENIIQRLCFYFIFYFKMTVAYAEYFKPTIQRKSIL
jgi:hypothetical protein